ncbi:hypothetical protein N657DRAFT_322708 [Parathielavia appendiculata]|uniref:Uncharacterized protein n=1 Tax=Parathielavia appendiculata TaxID=2587402 RepID=A0AAN6YZ16_9PEZI|nr:hypothetical protein N657DRAFT_322708 [Parathielavia appendiculata]
MIERQRLDVVSVPRPFRLRASGRNKFHPPIHPSCHLALALVVVISILYARADQTLGVARHIGSRRRL